MNLNSLKILAYLLMYGEKDLNGLVKVFGLSKSYLCRLVKELERHNLVKRLREDRRPLVSPNMTHLLVERLNKFLLLAGIKKEIIDLLSDKSALKVLSCFTGGVKATADLVKESTYSNPIVYSSLKRLEEYGVINKISSNPLRYNLNQKNNLGVLLKDISSMIFSQEIDKMTVSPEIEEIFDSIKTEQSVLVFVVYGSYVQSQTDKYGDIDLFVIVNTEQDKDRLLKKYSYPNIDLNITSKLGFIRLLKEQPYFVKQLKEGKILKGKELLEALL